LYETGAGFEVDTIEEQYIYYDKGGKFEPHVDTQCNPMKDCILGKEHMYPRLFTYLFFLNTDWKESDGGYYHTYYNWPALNIKQRVEPTLGKTVIIRADKTYHSAEVVNTVKRAISLFINVKP
jgi:Rps23 Pro-64 3,4-dihydroxylase Tpa1-like proline 4-hydroxylase